MRRLGEYWEGLRLASDDTLRALHHPAAVVSVRSRPIDQTTGIESPIRAHLHDVSLYRNLFRSYDRIRLTG